MMPRYGREMVRLGHLGGTGLVTLELGLGILLTHDAQTLSHRKLLI